MLRYGADVNVLTHYGVTALVHLCGNKSLDYDTILEITQLLLDAGADCSIKDFREARTALQVSRHVGNIDVALLYESHT